MSARMVDQPAGDVHTLAVEALEQLDRGQYADTRWRLERIRDIASGVDQALDAEEEASRQLGPHDDHFP